MPGALNNKNLKDNNKEKNHSAQRVNVCFQMLVCLQDEDQF